MIDPGEFGGTSSERSVYGTGRTWAQLEETLTLLGRQREQIRVSLVSLAQYLADHPEGLRRGSVLQRNREIMAQFEAVSTRLNAAVRAYETLRMGYGPLPADLAALTDDLDAHRRPGGAARYGYPVGQTDPAPLRSRIARQDFPTVERQRQDAPVETDAPEEGAEEEDPYEFGRPLDPLINRKRAEFARALVAYGRIKGEELRDEELSPEELSRRRHLEFGRWLRGSRADRDLTYGGRIQGSVWRTGSRPVGA